jgi:hypothetical protein
MAVLPVNKRRFILWLLIYVGNASRSIPHQVSLGGRSAARPLLLRVRTANDISCDAMGSPAGKPLMRCCTCRIEKRGAELLTRVPGWRGDCGGDGRYGDGGSERRRSQPDRQRPCAYARERTDCGCDNDDADQRVRHGREDFRPADGPMQRLHLGRGQPLGNPMVATQQGRAASGIDLRALRLRRMSVLPGAPFQWLNIDRRAEVAIDPVAGIGLLARKFKSRDCSAFADAKLNAAIARRRRNRVPWVRTKPWVRAKV